MQRAKSRTRGSSTVWKENASWIILSLFSFEMPQLSRNVQYLTWNLCFFFFFFQEPRERVQSYVYYSVQTTALREKTKGNQEVRSALEMLHVGKCGWTALRAKWMLKPRVYFVHTAGFYTSISCRISLFSPPLYSVYTFSLRMCSFEPKLFRLCQNSLK